MNKLFKFIGILFVILGLVGCNYIDEYYVYDENILLEIEKKFPSKDLNARDVVQEILESTRFRIKLSSTPTIELTVIQSYDVSNQLKEQLMKDRVITDFSSESRTYNTCEFINRSNWICKNFRGFGFGFEMKDGDLYKDGHKLIKKYSLNLK
jgi:hypothetical protein